MLMESLHGQRRWENEPADGWTVEHLDTAELVRTIEEAIRRGRAEDPGSRDPAMILRGLGLTRNGTILRAAAMLFGKSSRLEQEFPQCLLRVARFRGTDTTTFEDNRQFHGNAFRLLRRAERFLREHLPIAGRIVPELFQRIDDPLYPPVALREAIANAICHRDYTIGGGSIAVAIFDDRLEITSSGTLHFGLTVDALFGPHESLPWNPLIARVFYKCGIIEQWGRGTVKMVELAQQAGLPRPEIEEQAGRVTVRFRASGFASPARVVHEFSDRQRAILQLLQQQGRMALRDLKSALKGEALWAIKEDLSQLKSLGQVETGGHGRGAFWRLTKPSTQ